jgi:single-stranded-DNA-specific exonuclease
VLKNRDIDNAYRYLNTTAEERLDPLLLDNMLEGAKMLMKHIQANNKIFVQIDEDCDGYTSAALLINYLNKLFPHFAQNNIIYKTHERKEHGIVLDYIPDDVSLVVVPDASSNEWALHKTLVEQNKEVLVLDHHNAPSLPETWACIINNQLSQDYSNKSLSGVGVVYKFCSFFDALLGVSYADEFLDLVAVGEVADMMALNNYENKYLIETGINNIKNPFVSGMVAKNEFYLKGKLDPHGISFCIAPAVNAVARVGSPAERLIMFEAMLDFCAYDMVPSTKRGGAGQMETKVEQACRNCTNVRNRQNRDRDSSLKLAEKLIIEQDLLKNPILIIQFEHSSVNENLTGLIANQIAAKYNRPTLILNEVYVDGVRYWRGSGRNVKGTKFANFQQFLMDSHLVEYAAGHDNALGVSIYDIQMPQFKEYCATHVDESQFVPVHRVDLEFDAGEIDGLDILSLGDLKSIWGEGVEEPKIFVKNLKVNTSNLDLLKSSTIKITPVNREDNLSYIMFKAEDGVYDMLNTDGVITLNVVGTCARNDYNGQPQIIIQDFEITQKQSYYF